MQTTIVALLFLSLTLQPAPATDATAVPALESGAVGVLRTINTAQVTYANRYPDRGFACSLHAMLTRLNPAPPSPEHAALIDRSVKDEAARRYHFEVACVNKTKPAQAYRAIARPLVKGASAFCTDQSGLIRSSADGKIESCFAKGAPLT